VARAQTLLERSMTLDPAAPQPRMALARVLAQRGDPDAASQQLKDILGKNPRYEPATLGLVELALLRGERPQAKALLEKSISTDPAVIDSRLRLAQLSFEDGDLVKARGLLDQALAVTKDRKSTLNAVGAVLARAGLYDEALARFAAAGAAGSAEGKLNAARARVALGQKAEARAVLAAALADKPDWREATLMMIELDARDGQVERARERARKLPPSALSPQEIDGDIYAVAGKATDALAAYQAAERTRPNGSLAVKLFRTRLALRGPSPEESLVKWLNGQPTDAAVRAILANYYYQHGDIAKALMQYEHLAQAGTTDTTVLNNLAWLLHERGDSRALGLARKAYEITPSVMEVADTYGWILVQTGSAEEGLKVLERAAAAAAGNGDVTYHLAVAQARAGRHDRAVATLTELLRSNATFASRGEAERTLQSLASGTP
jgi:putative PEP-CTERM system TPR-repeat lipoprotein